MANEYSKRFSAEVTVDDLLNSNIPGGCFESATVEFESMLSGAKSDLTIKFRGYSGLYNSSPSVTFSGTGHCDSLLDIYKCFESIVKHKGDFGGLPEIGKAEIKKDCEQCKEIKYSGGHISNMILGFRHLSDRKIGTILKTFSEKRIGGSPKVTVIYNIPNYLDTGKLNPQNLKEMPETDK